MVQWHVVSCAAQSAALIGCPAVAFDEQSNLLLCTLAKGVSHKMNVGCIECGMPHALGFLDQFILKGQQPFALKGLALNRTKLRTQRPAIQP